MVRKPGTKFESNPRIEMRLEQFLDLFAATPGPARISASPNAARPKRPVTYIKSPGRAPERLTDFPAAISPSTVMLIAICESEWYRRLRPEFATRREARLMPRQKPIKPLPGRRSGRASVKREESWRGAHRREVAGGANQRFVADRIRRSRFAGRKWTPSRNASQLRTNSLSRTER